MQCYVTSKCKSLSHIHLTLCNPWDCSPPGSSFHGISQARILECGSHSLLQQIFLTQGSNPDVLACRQILYRLSHQGSPIKNVIQCSHFRQHLTVCLFVFGHTTWLAGSQFPNQGLNYGIEILGGFPCSSVRKKST